MATVPPKMVSGMIRPLQLVLNIIPRLPLKLRGAKCLDLQGANLATTMKATTIGIDLAKEVFHILWVNEHGKRMFYKQLKRSQIAANIPPGLIGIEACSSAHFWANKLQGLGHTVKLMAPQWR